MKREAVLGLQEERWLTPFEEDQEFQLCIVPAHASVMQDLFGVGAERAEKRLCQRAFTKFRGYENGDGKPIENTLAARLELFQVLPVRRCILDGLAEANEEIARGEGRGGSDS